MPLFRSGGDADAERRADESLRALEAGGIPIPAQQRLDDLRTRCGRFFTSDLTTPEFLLARESGFRPLTQVLGSCFYHVGWQWMPMGQWGSYYGRSGGGQTVELETQTEAWNEARRLAFGRLAEEARRAGADAVVGVRVTRGAYDWSQGVLEFAVAGTAVRSERYELGDEPVLSNLSGQEFEKLVQSGWFPTGIVAGTTVCYVMTGWQQSFRAGGLFSSMQNQELPDFTRGIYDARSQAMMRVTRQAHEIGAHGMVGVRFDRAIEEREREVNNVKYTDLVVTMHVLGTAILEVRTQEPPPDIFIALPLDQETR
jgi:uncharacterized protein YbjQ (UPF0145 family)